MPEKIRPERIHPDVGLNHKKLNSGSITDARRNAAEAKDLALRVDDRYRQYIQGINNELGWRRKEGAYLRKMVGYLLGVLKAEGFISQEHIHRIMFMALNETYTPEEVAAMNKANASIRLSDGEKIT